MRYEQDYVMRMIKEMTEVLARIIFHRKTPFYELDMENKYRSGEDFYLKLCKLADAGKINEAENLLYEKLDREEQDYLEMALAFYYHINQYTNGFLENHGYSRTEIEEGIETVLKEFGMEGMLEVAKLEIK